MTVHYDVTDSRPTPAPLRTLRAITAANVARGNVITEQPAPHTWPDACYVCGKGAHAPVDDAYSTHAYWSNADADAEFAGADARTTHHDAAAAYVAEYRPY